MRKLEEIASPGLAKSDLPALWAPESRPVRAQSKNCRIWEQAKLEFCEKARELALGNLRACLTRLPAEVPCDSVMLLRRSSPLWQPWRCGFGTQSLIGKPRALRGDLAMCCTICLLD